jgi:glycosyltransferase involved in cell wall biosynthesis
MISVAICSCLNHEEREEYLKKLIDSIHSLFDDDVEILIGFDKFGKEIDGARCHIHEKGMGHSWNWCLQNASSDYILQTEDDWEILIGGANIENLPDKNSFFHYLENRMLVLDESEGIFRFTNTADEFWKPGKTKRVLDGGFEYLEANRPELFKMNTWDMFLYTNQPHLKKKGLHEKVGYYLENAPPHEVETDMCQKFIENGGRSFMNPFFTMVHIGEKQSRKS